MLWCALRSAIPGKEERIVETEMQAGRAAETDAGTVCRQYVVGKARGAIAGLLYRRSRRAGARAGRVVVAAVEVWWWQQWQWQHWVGAS